MANLDTSATGIFRLHFRYPVGRSGIRHHRSLDTKDEAEALRIKAGVETTIKHLNEGVIRVPDGATSDEVWQFLRSGGRVTEQPTIRRSVGLDALIDRFIADREQVRPISAKTEKVHSRHLKRIFKTIFKRTPKAEEVEATHVRQYISIRKTEPGIRGGKVQGITIRKELATLGMVWDFGRSEKLLKSDSPVGHVTLPKKNQKPPFRTWKQIEAEIAIGGLTADEAAEQWDCLFLRPQEIADFLAHVKEASKQRRYPWIYPALAFCAYTAARRGEMFRCRMGDVNGKVIIRERKKNPETEETTRDVPLHPKLAVILAEWKEIHPGGPFLFCKDNGKQLEDRTSRDGFDAVTEKSKWENLRGYHVLRHSFISILAMKGRSQREIMDLAGHETEQMYHRYCHLFPEKRDEAMAALDF